MAASSIKQNALTQAFTSRAPRALPRTRLRCQPVRVKDVNEASFQAEVLQADKPVLVDFWASWCGPCRLVAPLCDWVEKEYPNIKVVKIEHDANKGLIEQYKVYGLPTLILFKDGAEVAGSKREGAVTKPMLLSYLKQHGLVA